MTEILPFCALALLYLVQNQQQLYQSVSGVLLYYYTIWPISVTRPQSRTCGWNGTGIFNHDWRWGWY